MRMTAYGCCLSTLTRFTGPHCEGPSSETEAPRPESYLYGLAVDSSKGAPEGEARRPGLLTARGGNW